LVQKIGPVIWLIRCNPQVYVFLHHAADKLVEDL
jgi:hypothetical protein